MRFLKPAFIGIIGLPLVLSLSACGDKNKAKNGAKSQSVHKIVKDDKFTYANYDEVQVSHLDLNLDVNFDDKVLDGTAVLTVKKLNSAADKIVLDTKDLEIMMVKVENHGEFKPVRFTLANYDEMLGSELTIPLSKNSGRISIAYKTSPKAEGLQWLDPEQTAGKKKPYLFSQAQTINARTIAPLQDTPAVRMTYSATLRVPDGLLPLMSAEQNGKDANGEYHFKMPQPIPSYLLAIAVGDIKFKAINDHIGVYAEQYILDAATKEFEETPRMEEATARLYGPYRWNRYDLIVLPPSFPFGGMENPRLSFMTPTLIAGDKSLTNVVAHELAHSWSGNLVTNANWRDAWLNEGFTSYVENRIMEELYGEKRAVMEQVLGLQGLTRDIADAARPELTHLKLPADLGHPDDAFTLVAYKKGQFFLRFLEQRYGRKKFDPFLKSYFDHFAFKSITTEDFLGYLQDNLAKENPGKVSKAEIDAWVYGPGLPDTFVPPQSDAFDKVFATYQKWDKGEIKASDIETKDWTTHEWLHFLNSMNRTYSTDKYKDLDDAFHLTGTQNAEIAFAWYMQAIKGNYAAVDTDLEDFLMSVGRGKFIYRLYGALAKNENSLKIGKKVYAKARSGYHPIAQRRIDAIFAKTEK
ncbi:MAG: M1 family metallopeptidase [Robiginitomaculum sp.]